MRISMAALLGAVSLALCGCQTSESPAREVGKEAYKVKTEAQKAAKEAGKELKKASKEMEAGWKEAQHESAVKKTAK
jgi:hypothetical protein